MRSIVDEQIWLAREFLGEPGSETEVLSFSQVCDDLAAGVAKVGFSVLSLHEDGSLFNVVLQDLLLNGVLVEHRDPVEFLSEKLGQLGLPRLDQHVAPLLP